MEGLSPWGSPLPLQNQTLRTHTKGAMGRVQPLCGGLGSHRLPQRNFRNMVLAKILANNFIKGSIST